MAELTGLLTVPADYPKGMRIIVRRERPHPAPNSTPSKNTSATTRSH